LKFSLNFKLKRVDLKTGFLCNNNCLFCVQADNKTVGNRSFEEIKKDIIESRKNCEGIVLTGGEVTIRSDFLEIVKLCKECDYKIIQIQTNGRMFCNLDFCKKTIEAGATEFSPALHGFCAEQHDKLTRAKGSFRQTIKGIINLKKLKMSIITNTVVVKENYKDLEKIANLFVRLKVDQFQFAFVHGIGNAKINFDTVVPNMTESSKYIKKALDIGIKNNIRCMAEAVPFCLMKDYENQVSENYIPKTQIRGRKHQNTDNYENQRVMSGKMKFPQCEKCKKNDVCEGPWKEYPEHFGNDEFQPIL
jgi:MoaA/NifB/PqqE/SkfB family radical SAM enzyme